ADHVRRDVAGRRARRRDRRAVVRARPHASRRRRQRRSASARRRVGARAGGPARRCSREGRAVKPVRLTIVETHPIQDNAPLFRHIARHCPELDLTVLYASRPTPAQQAVGYAGAFEWDSDLLDGYRSRVVRDSRPDESFDSENYDGIDVEEIGDALLETTPDVALVAGWHSKSQMRAIASCRQHRIPLVYRGDTHLGMRPSRV